jgi:outer membrane protein, heavy metal efflux system
MMCAVARAGLTLALFCGLGAASASAQTSAFPSVEEGEMVPGARSSSLGRSPGAGGAPAEATAPEESLLGGRPGFDFPRVPTGITNPGSDLFRMQARQLIEAPPRAPITEPPLYGTLSLPERASDEGPPDGLTLDAAIDRLVRENLDLRARYHEIPMADADVLTAGLRANPIVYADSQLIPYSRYSRARPGGPTQYDANISHPVDLSGKRQARTAVAVRAKRVLEAQYQDAVRLQIDGLASAFLDVLAAVENVHFARASVAGLDQVLDVTRRLRRRGVVGPDDVDRIEIQREAAAIGQDDAEEALRRAKRSLAVLLNLPLDRADDLRLRGTIHDTYPPPPPVETLVRIALETRPDLVAYRLGVHRAEADVRLARANRFQDVYVQYQPYTFQDISPYGLKGAHSWAVGLAVPLPVYNRNQGNIHRAELNVSQTKTEQAALERRIVAEVQQAEREYSLTRAAVERIERKLLPTAVRVRDHTLRRFSRGDAEVVAYLNSQREYNEVVREYRDFLIRHRRSMLALNTAVGQRILP